MSNHLCPKENISRLGANPRLIIWIACKRGVIQLMREINKASQVWTHLSLAKKIKTTGSHLPRCLPLADAWTWVAKTRKAVERPCSSLKVMSSFRPRRPTPCFNSHLRRTYSMSRDVPKHHSSNPTTACSEATHAKQALTSLGIIARAGTRGPTLRSIYRHRRQTAIRNAELLILARLSPDLVRGINMLLKSTIKPRAWKKSEKSSNTWMKGRIRKLKRYLNLR